MKTNEGTIALPDAKADDKALRTYFTSLVPDHDQQRVYVTDIKKMIKWYKALDTEGVIVLEKEEAKPAAKKTTAKAKPAAKKASATKAKSTTKADSEAKPKKATKKAPKSEK